MTPEWNITYIHGNKRKPNRGGRKPKQTPTDSYLYTLRCMKWIAKAHEFQYLEGKKP